MFFNESSSKIDVLKLKKEWMMRGKLILIATSLVLALSTNVAFAQQAPAKKEKTTKDFKTKRGTPIKLKNGSVVQTRAKNFHRR